MNGGKPPQFNLKQHQESKQTLQVVYQLSELLNCGIDRQSLSLLISLCQSGVNPQALAEVVKELRRQTQALQADQMSMRNGFTT